MLGAIIGDLAGSIYEFDQMKEVKKIKVKKLIEDNAFFSDEFDLEGIARIEIAGF